MSDCNPIYTEEIIPENINLTWNTIAQMDDDTFEDYLKLLQKYLIDAYRLRRNPIMMGQKSEKEIRKSLINFSKLDIHGTLIEKLVTADNKKLNVVKNYNKFGNVVNHWFPEISETKVARNTKDKNPRSVIDNIEDWVFFKRNMSAVLKRDRMRLFKDRQDEPIFPAASVALKLGSGTQPVTNFPPSIAKWVYEYHLTKYFKEEEKYYVLDPSMGWGGRMIGLLAASEKIERPIVLVGTDVNTTVHDRFDMIYEYWKNKIVNPNDECWMKLHKYVTPAEDLHKNAEFKTFCGLGHLAFTSPPYFNRENYSNDDTQSFIRYGNNYELWRDDFLRKMVENSYNFLRPGGILIINIADIKIGKDKYYPLEQDTIDAATDLGMQYIDKYHFLLSPIIGNNKAKNFITIKEDVSTVDENAFFESKNPEQVETTYKFEPMFVFKK